jgi:hypothetical protein
MESEVYTIEKGIEDNWKRFLEESKGEASLKVFNKNIKYRELGLFYIAVYNPDKSSVQLTFISFPILFNLYSRSIL